MEVKKIVEGMTASQVAQVIEDNFTGLNTEKADKKEVERKYSELTKKLISENIYDFNKYVARDGYVLGYYITNSGAWKSQGGQTTQYWPVKEGELYEVYCNGNNYYASYAIFENVPDVNDSPIIYEPLENTGNTFMLVVPRDGYLAVSGMNLNSNIKTYTNNKEYVQKIENSLNDHIKENEEYTNVFGESIAEDGYILQYYINSSGAWTYLYGQTTKYWKVKKGEVYQCVSGTPDAYSAYSIFDDIPTLESVPSIFVPRSDIGNVSAFIVTVQKDGYLALSNQNFYASLHKKTKVDNEIKNIKKEIDSLASRDEYYGKTCIYIGDSISVMNNYKWKGLIENSYNIKYVREKEPLWPAQGGRTVIPTMADINNSHTDANMTSSIWYRCAEKRMAIYDFDFISLFGGINDLSDGLNLGTINDLPLVDKLEGFSEDKKQNLTTVRSDNPTFCQSYMGCIEMLRRDFPDKEIILCTVVFCGRGQKIVENYFGDISVAEKVAMLQMDIATKYGLKCVPLYWDMRGPKTNRQFSVSGDGVHPNLHGAIRLQTLYAQTLGL